MRKTLPSGTVTFLFTDMEGSTRLLHALGAEAYAEALAEHRAIIREACAQTDGVEVDTQGDAFFFAFPTVPGALAAASSFTRTLASGQIQVRVGIHTGTPLLADEGYVGDDVHFAARVGSAAHGGQVVVSAATRAACDDQLQTSLVSLGSHRLKDIAEPVSLYQLGDGSFPPLKTIANSNLPSPASSFLGRQEELREADLLLQQTRLLTIHGPGGQGKTRFALELATRAREERFSDYQDGVFSCFLSSLRDPALVLPTIAQTLSVREQPGLSALEALTGYLQAKKLLLVLDNLEHLLACAPELSQLLFASPNLTLLVTSRELLRISGEVPYGLPPLPEDEGVALFCERSRLEPSATIAEIARRLEGLPLAIELAAARTRILTIEQLLERLSQRLDLLKGGRDADPRQQTLRATIEWSYDLLSPEEQQLFARLSVFQGGCTLEAAEEVCDADLDSLQSLVDKSLLRFSDERFWMLETIREFAGERLEESGEAEVVGEMHVAWTLKATRRLSAQSLRGGEQARALAELEIYGSSISSALSRLVGAGDHERAVSLCLAATQYWDVRDHWIEADGWFECALASDDLDPGLRAVALSEHATFVMYRGDVERAISALQQSITYYESRGDDGGLALALARLGSALASVGRLEEARPVLGRSLEHAVAAGDRETERLGAHLLGELERDVQAYGRAVELLERSLVLSVALNDEAFVCATRHSFGDLELDRRNLAAAARAYCESLEMARRLGMLQQLTMCLGGLSCVAFLQGKSEIAGALWAAVTRYERERGVPLFALERARYEEVLGPLAGVVIEPASSLADAAALALASSLAD